MINSFLRPALLGVLSILAVAFAACGDDSAPEETVDLGPDPVTMVPADAPFYTEVVVRPEGSLGDDLNAALGKLLNEDDPGAMIREKLDEELSSDPESGGLTYTEDVEPWLGSRTGVFVTDFGEGEDPDGAGIVAITDPEAAQAFIDKAIATDSYSSPPTDETYEGVDYKFSETDDMAIGIDGEFLVAGTQSGFEAAVDAGAGDSLADSEDASTAIDEAPENSLFSLYVDTPAIIDLVKSSGSFGEAELGQLDDQLAQYGDGPISAWGTVTDSSFAIGGSSPAAEGAAEASDLISSFPADSWLAFAAANAGEQLRLGIEQGQAAAEDQLKGLEGLEGVTPADLDPIAQVRKETGIDLNTDFDWVGETGGFVEGTSILGLGGGIVIEATDEDAASETLDKARAAIEKDGTVSVTPSSSGDGFSIAVPPTRAEIALQDGKVVAAIGGDSIDDVVSPDETLEDSERFSAARDVLDDGATPSFFLDFAPILALAESSGQLEGDTDYAMAKPYLDALDFLVSGSTLDGDRTSGSFVLGVKDSEETSGETASAAITP